MQRKNPYHLYWLLMVLMTCLACRKATDTGSSEFFPGLKAGLGKGVIETQDWTTDQVQLILNNLDKHIPVLEEAGFNITEVAVTLAVIPSVEVSFTRERRISAAKQEELLNQYRNEVVLHTLLDSLFRTGELDLGHYSVRKTIVVLTIPPKTRLILKPEGA